MTKYNISNQKKKIAKKLYSIINVKHNQQKQYVDSHQHFHLLHY